MKNLTKLVLACVLTLGIVTPALAQGIVLSLVPQTNTKTTVGGSLTYDLNISGLQSSVDAPNTPALAAYDIYVDFNSSVVSATSGTIGSNLIVDANGDSSSFIPPVTLSSGVVEFTDISFGDAASFSNQAMSFTIGTLTLQGVGVGTSTVTIDWSLDSALSASSLSDQNANNIAIDSVNASNVVVAPEPSSMMMIALIGLPALAFLTIRRRMTA
jgi:hypothetical protein